MTATAAGGCRLAVVGAGWAGLAAAVRAVQAGHQVVLFEMAHHVGGRARSVELASRTLDNGQHILIGAYTHTLALLEDLGVAQGDVLLRRPLTLRYPDGRGLAMAPGRPLWSFVRAVLRAQGWSWRDRLVLLREAIAWHLGGFTCPATLSVAQLGAPLTPAVVADLIEPLCVAALNTPASQASAQVFLRVLRDALFAGPGSADLLLPRAPLSALLPDPAARWLASAGAEIRLGQRVATITPEHSGWRVDGERFDGVTLACSAAEAARLALPINAGWSAIAAALVYEPICTVYLADAQLRLPLPMMALAVGPAAPAQFVFDLGALGMAEGLFAFVVSGARPWLAAGQSALCDIVLQQARHAFAGGFQAPDEQVLNHASCERRATFSCTPGLQRPPMRVAAGLHAAGDYVAGPYPATLEGAVRSGQAAIDALASAPVRASA